MSATTDRKALEEARVAGLESAVTEIRVSLEKAGLRAEILPIRRSGEGDVYDSEVEIYVWAGNRITDALSYPLVRGDRAVEEIEDWQTRVKADLEEILERPVGDP